MIRVELTCEKHKKGGYVCWVRTPDGLRYAAEIDKWWADHVPCDAVPDVAGRDL